MDQSIDALRLKVEQVSRALALPSITTCLHRLLTMSIHLLLDRQKRLLLQTLQKATLKSQHALTKARALSEELAFFKQTSEAYSRTSPPLPRPIPLSLVSSP